MKSVIVAALAVPALGSSPVQKVIELIGELKTKVQNDLQAESKAMAEYSTFCDDEQAAKGFAIKTAASQIEGYKAVIEETTGNIQSLSSAIETAGGEASAKTQELQSATKVRENENGDFKAAEKELVDAVDTLSRAIVIIKREMSFAQGGNSQVAKKLTAMSGALNQVIAAAWLDSSSRSKLKNFLSTDMDDELTLKQPQAAVHNYENHSKGITDTLEDMKDKAETALNNLRREDTKARHAFELIKQSLTDAVTVLNKEVAQAQASSSAASEKLAKAEGDLATTEAAKKADEEYLAKLESDCSAKASEWEERQKSAKAELEALTKGGEILSAKFNFAQLKTTTRVMKSEDVSESRDKVMAVLKKLGRQYNSFAMMQIANAAAKDPFAKVRGLIESMIGKLEQQAQEEATHEAFCQEEMAKSTKAREHKEAASDKYQARIDEAKAAHAELKNDIAELSGEIAEIESATQKATKMRQGQHADYQKSSKDFKESAEAITQALVVLKDFYKGGAAFVQQPSFGSSKSEGAHMILEVLEVAQSDFSRLLAEAETSESDSLEAYKSLMQDNKVAKKTKEASVKAKNSEMKSIEVALTHHREDLDTVSTELTAVLDYLSKLKPQCESKAMTYEERKARREAEMAGLQEALSILEGEDVAAFIQTKGFLQKKLMI